MNVKEIKELADLVARRGLACLEVERAGFRIRIEGPRPGPGPLRRSALGTPADLGDDRAVVDAVPVPAAPTLPAPAPAPGVEEGLHVVTSPIVGTFYRAPNPDSDPFVKPGDRVEKGTTLCIVEAMKLMNEIESDVAGTVVEIYPKNGQPVEFGEKLFAVRPS